MRQPCFRHTHRSVETSDTERERERAPPTPMCQPMSRCSIWGLAMGVPPVIHFERWDLHKNLINQPLGSIWGVSSCIKTPIYSKMRIASAPPISRGCRGEDPSVLPGSDGSRGGRAKGISWGFSRNPVLFRKASWLVVTGCHSWHFPINIGLLSSSQMTFIFFRGVALAPPASQGFGWTRPTDFKDASPGMTMTKNHGDGWVMFFVNKTCGGNILQNADPAGFYKGAGVPSCLGLTLWIVFSYAQRYVTRERQNYDLPTTRKNQPWA